MYVCIYTIQATPSACAGDAAGGGGADGAGGAHVAGAQGAARRAEPHLGATGGARRKRLFASQAPLASKRWP